MPEIDPGRAAAVAALFPGVVAALDAAHIGIAAMTRPQDQVAALERLRDLLDGELRSIIGLQRGHLHAIHGGGISIRETARACRLTYPRADYLLRG